MNDSNNEASSYKAGIAGAGGGTLLVVLANNLPDDWFVKSWLVIIAPSAAILLRSLWIRLTRGFEKRGIVSSLKKTEEMIEDYISKCEPGKHRELLIKEKSAVQMETVHFARNEIKSRMENFLDKGEADGD